MIPHNNKQSRVCVPGRKENLWKREKAKTILKFWPLHLIVLAITLIFEYINTITIPTPLGNILFLPMLFAMVAGLIIYLIKPIKWVKDEASNVSDTFVVVGISVFLAKVSITSGIELPKIFAAGPALILQEFGNLGTIILALPFALLFGFKREAIGMTNSIGREPNVGLIASKYGLNSPEGRGVMTTYIVGTLVGTIFMGVMANFLGVSGILHPYALAMACGVGSGSMMAASSASLAASFPEMADQITAYAATSNVLSTADGIIMTVFLGLPMCEWLYKKLSPIIGKDRSKKG